MYHAIFDDCCILSGQKRAMFPASFLPRQGQLLAGWPITTTASGIARNTFHSHSWHQRAGCRCKREVGGPHITCPTLLPSTHARVLPLTRTTPATLARVESKVVSPAAVPLCFTPENLPLSELTKTLEIKPTMKTLVFQTVKFPIFS